MTAWAIPLSDLDYGEEETAAAVRVLQSRWLSSGAEVAAFEREFADFQGAKHAIAVSSATAALHLALLAVGVNAGDEVVQPAINFVAAANMTVACGARPVFADIIGPLEPTIDPTQVERLISDKTKAIVVMHYGGNLCRMAELVGLARARGIALVEDSCHALGAAYVPPAGHAADGLKAGSIGAIGTFSFFANKNLPTGEGGMLVTNDDAFADATRAMRSHGMTSMSWDRYRGRARSYDVSRHGFNYRLDELRAALGRAQLAKLPRHNARRRALLHAYRRYLAGNSWAIPFAAAIERSGAHLMVAVAPEAATRERAIAALSDARIQSSLHYPCIADFAAFAGMRAGDLARSRDFQARALTLPLYPTMTEGDVARVCAVLALA